MVHEAAEDGFGRNAGIYQQARPSYPSELLARFVDHYGSDRILEIGAGSGIFTQQLVDAGLDVVAVEPVASMRDHLMQQVPCIEVLDGTAERLPVGDASFDVVAVAQSFHWFDFERSLDEICRVLRPSGHLVTVWNVKSGTSGWFMAYMAIVDRYAGDTPRHAQMKWRAAIDADSRFRLIDDWAVDHPKPTDADGVVNRALSTSFIAALPAAEQSKVEAELRAVLAPSTEQLEFPYRAEIQAWQRTSDTGASSPTVFVGRTGLSSSIRHSNRVAAELSRTSRPGRQGHQPVLLTGT